MRLVKMVSMALAVTVAAAGAVHAESDAANRFGKGPTTIGLTPGGWNAVVARSYARDFQQYVQTAPKVELAVGTYISDRIGDYIAKADKHFSGMRIEAVAAKDKETLASLDAIDVNLTAAKKAHNEMREMCLMTTVDKPGIMKCCEQIDDSLAKVIAEHDILMKRLGLANPTPTASTKSAIVK